MTTPNETNPVPAPPLGIESEYIWHQKRIDDLCAAITRYREAHRVVPTEWYAELGKLCRGQGYGQAMYTTPEQQALKAATIGLVKYGDKP